jgi:hypothetical protein
MALEGSLRIRGEQSLTDTILSGMASGLTARANLHYAHPVGGAEPAAAFGRRRNLGLGRYPEHLTKLFPAEAAVAYPLVIGAAGDDAPLRIGLIAMIALAVIGFRYLTTQPKGGGRPDWLAIFIAVTSFLLWAAALGGFGDILPTRERSTMLVTSFIVLWLGLVPLLTARVMAAQEDNNPPPAPKRRAAPAKAVKGATATSRKAPVRTKGRKA